MDDAINLVYKQALNEGIIMEHENMGSLVSDWRKLRGLSQMELAEKLGYRTAQFISNVERGICSFPIDKFKKLSKVLGFKPELLIDAYIADLSTSLKREILGKK